MPRPWPTTLAVLLAAPSAGAVEPARLVYERGRGAEACPDEGAARGAVADLLGEDPFRDDAARTIGVVVSRRGQTFQGRIAVGEGDSAALRVLRDRSRDCAELASAMALAIAIAIDPLAGTRPEPPAAAAPEPAPEPISTPTPPPAQPMRARLAAPVAVVGDVTPEPERGEPLVLHVAAGLVAGLGALPGPAAGASLAVGASKGIASVSIEGRFDLPASVEVSPGRADVSLLFGAVVPCVTLRPVAACGIVGVGALRSEGVGLETNLSTTSTFVAGGARLLAEAPIGGAFALQARLDALAPLTRTRILVGEAPVWETPLVSGAAGLAVVGRF